MKHSQKRRLFLVSNMYPSKRDVRYGIFVKHFEEAVKQDYSIEKIVLTKKNDSLSKLVGYFVLYLKVMSLFFRSRKEDIIYVHFPLYFSIALTPLTLRRVPLVLNFHGSDATFGSTLKTIFKWFLAPLTLKARKIVVPSKYYQEVVAQTFGIHDIGKIYIYPSGGVSSKLFHPLRNTPKENFVFGFVSNFIEKKGWKIFLEALSILSKDNPFKAKGVMVGDGPDKNQIIKMIKDHKLDVKLIGNVTQDQLSKIYSSFSVFVFPTYREEESLGLVGIEAMMCGIPVIASKVGGPMGYVEEGYNGFLFEKRSVEDLVGKMQKFQRLEKIEVESMKKNCIITAKRFEKTLVNKGMIMMLESIDCT